MCGAIMISVERAPANRVAEDGRVQFDATLSREYHTRPMEQLWAPWRMPYLQGGARPEGCFFCTLGAGKGEPESLAQVVWRGESVYALLNRYPYSNGHTMVVPYIHEGRLEELESEVSRELMSGVRRTIRALALVYSPEGFNVGLNLGSAAGAGFGDHLHFHVVPRWSGDTNFMSTTGGTRVVPESLDETARRLSEAFMSLSGSDDRAGAP
jgi:ATP adenylyltransferase